jgi:FimV-like protein
MVSPNDSSLTSHYNWARVIKHEMVHVVTLQQTDYNCPHWFTEGLAVWSEGYPRPQRWNQLLADRVPNGRLFNLDTINFRFTRPHSSEDWQMAYCQAELYVEYALEEHGPQAIHELLQAYAGNLATEKAIARAFAVSQDTFEQGYRQFLKQVAAELVRVGAPDRRSFFELLQARREDPTDADLTARLADAHLRRGAAREASELAEEAARRDPGNQLAAYVLARLHVRAGRTSQAIELLERRLDRTRPHPKTLNLLAGLRLKAEDYAEAAQLYELGVKHNPHDSNWLRALARVYVMAGNDEKLAGVLESLASSDPDDAGIRKKLAQMALSRGDFDSAALWANRALEIDVMDADIHRVLAKALANRHNYALAIEELKIAVDLNPDVPQTRLALADAYLQDGDEDGARRVLEELLMREPHFPPARNLLESLEEPQDRD